MLSSCHQIHHDSQSSAKFNFETQTQFKKKIDALILDLFGL